jgi:ABC-type transporter MlaC component
MIIRLICSNFFMLAALVFSPSGLGATIKSDLRVELGEMVAVFNEHAQTLDIDDVGSVQAFNGFIDQILSKHWDAEHMAIHLLTDAKYQSLSADEQLKIRQSLETTFHRYVYEILQEYRGAHLALVGGVFQSKKGNLRIKIRGKPRILPALTGELYLANSADGWAIIDAGYANFTYISLKRRAYQRKLRRTGVDGLTGWLDKKNRRFFADYCVPHLDLVMPVRISDLCEVG